MNARQVLAAAGIALAALVGGVLVAVAQTVVEDSTPEPAPASAVVVCVPIGPADEDALPGNLTELGVPFHLTAGHSELCARPAHTAAIASERAAIAAAGGYQP